MSYIDYSSRPKASSRFVDEEDDVEARPAAVITPGPQSNISQRSQQQQQQSQPQTADPFADQNAIQQQQQQAAQGQAQPALEHPYYGGAGSSAQPYEHGTAQRHHLHEPGHAFNVEHIATSGDQDRAELEQTHPYGNAQAQQQEPFFDPTFEDYTHEAPLEMPFFDHVVQDYGNFTLFSKIRLAIRQALSFTLTLSGLGIVLVAAFGSYFNPFAKRPPRRRADREYERRITGERGSGRVQYYAEYWGYRCDEHEIVTEGGWILKAHRLSDPRRPGGAGYPVILQHGILCNGSHFIMNEDRSLAFWLVDQGYDVWLTNIRANFDAGHTEFSRGDPRFWAWGLKELAFDLRDVVEFVCEATAHSKIAYVGHSQGSGSMYLALSPGICPELGDRLSVFVALGPSVYAGPVLRQFPFSLIRKFRSRKWWSLVFGVKEFIPAIGLFQRWLPTFIFGHLAFVIFKYLFSFHMSLTPKRQIPKVFRSLPVPTSSELLYWYMAAWAARGCIFDPRMQEPWFPRSFPPHSVFYGNIDMLVLGKPLAQRLQRNERNVDIVHCVELDGYEHLDFMFAHDAHRTVFPAIKDSIESTIDPEDAAPAMRQVDNTPAVRSRRG